MIELSACGWKMALKGKGGEVDERRHDRWYRRTYTSSDRESHSSAVSEKGKDENDSSNRREETEDPECIRQSSQLETDQRIRT